ncbi:MAG: hypothetical protein PHP53_23630 [Prolixibacteraceae bacterium]|nr:hypothetical protein [Prolixibacteraceae bacterium]
MSDVKYFNFPVTLLKELFEDKQKVLNDILYFALYSHSLKMDAEDLYSNSEFNKFTTAAKFYNVDLGGNDQNKKNKLKQGKALFESIPTDTPKVGLNISIFWDYYKNDKSEFEIACLAAFLAIKSILGTKPYCKTDNSFLWARMSGNAKAIKDVNKLSEGVKKYANDYQTVKIKTALREGWKLVTYSRYTRGFYVSFTLDLPALILEAETRRKSTKEKQYRQHEKEIVKQVLAGLKEATS